MRDEISNFRQLPTKVSHETWGRFKKKLTQCLNYNIHLMETLYRALNSVTKPIIDNAIGGSFVDLTFPKASEMLERITNRVGHGIPETVVASPTIFIGMTTEQRKRDEEHNQDMAYLKTQIDLLTKHLHQERLRR